MSVIVRNPGEDPFRISSDPRLAHFDAPRRRATARLLSGLYQGEGLFLLTGEDGIGKTTLLRHLGEEVATLDGVQLLHTAAFIDSEVLSTFADIIGACGDVFRVGTSDPLVVARILQDLSDGEQMPSLLIDNAHSLDDATLRGLAMLTTLRGGERRLLSAVLAGEPELAGRMSALLGTNDQLLSSHVVTLSPMGRADVERLIRHRLRLAGRPESDRIADVVAQSNGVPLQVLGLCRRALGEAAAVAAVPLPPAAAPLREEPPAPRLELAPAKSAKAAAIELPAAALPAEAAADAAAAGVGDPTAVVPPPSPPSSPPETVPSLSLPEQPRGLDDGANWPELAGGDAVPPAAEAVRELPGHIRYGVASAMRIEGSQWQDGRRRRPRHRALLVAAGVALVVLGTGWSLYDHTPKRLAEGSASTSAVAPASPKAEAPFAAVLEPPHAAPATSVGSAAPASGVPPEGRAVVGGETTAVPAQPEPWWRPSGAERLRADLPAAGSGSDPAAAGGSAVGEMPVARPAPPEPVARPADPPKLMPAAKPRASVVATAPSDDIETAPLARPAEPETLAKPAAAPKPAPAVKPRPAAVAVATPPGTEEDYAAAYPAEPKAPARTREALLTAGDEQIAMGDVAAARMAYQEAFTKGSAEAARRMAETFDPRNVAAHSKEASAAEAILWYKDAARKGDRRSRGELHGLEVWLEDAAASGDGEARRVLQAWRTPTESDADVPAEP